MKKPQLSYVSAVIAVTTIFALQTGLVWHASAQYSQFSNSSYSNGEPVQVDRSLARLDLITGTSRVLKFDYNVPELIVDNQNVIRATPIAANQVLLTALQPGIAAVTISDPEQKTQTINILVRGDVRGLEMNLQQIFPNSNIRATALETGVVLSGTLARADQVPTVLGVANEYFPKVHNNIRLPDSQLIAIEVQVYEVARTKVRELGIDWQISTDDLDLTVAGGQNTLNTVFFSVVNNGDELDLFLQALETRSLARLLDRPTIVTMNGRPAEFLEGGEIPFEIAQGFGTTSLEFRPFGTKLDVVPIVQGEGTIRLEVRAEVSEPSADLSNATGTPGFRVRRVNTGVDMKIGHTLALAGDIREETESQINGIPWLMNTPYLGAFFRRVQETKSEIELVILLTPRYIGEMDPALMPVTMPGRSSVSPSDCQLYYKGHTEVPRCGPDCGHLPNQPQDPLPGHYQPLPAVSTGFTMSDNTGAGNAAFTVPHGGWSNQNAPYRPIGNTHQTTPRYTLPPELHPNHSSANPNGGDSRMNWIQDPTQVAPPTAPSSTPGPNSGFGFPIQEKKEPSPRPAPRTGSTFNLKNLFRR